MHFPRFIIGTDHTDIMYMHVKTQIVFLAAHHLKTLEMQYLIRHTVFQNTKKSQKKSHHT